MTFTAIRPDLGLAKGREVSLLSVAQASSLISSFEGGLDHAGGQFQRKATSEEVYKEEEARWDEREAFLRAYKIPYSRSFRTTVVR